MLKLVLVLITIILALQPQISRANTIFFADDFDRQTLNDWQIVQNTGSASWPFCLDNLSIAAWKIESGWAKLIVDGISCTLAISPKKENLITTKNWQIDFDWRLDESIDMDRNFVWWWQNQDNWFDIKLYGTGIHLQKVIQGQVYSLDQNHTTYPFLPNQIYHFTIRYQAKKISVFIDNQLVLETNDLPPFLESNPTLALKTSLGSKRSVSSFDNIFIQSLDTPIDLELNVPLYKQTNPEWAELVYDHAADWSTNPTFERWACALASATMILKFHRFDTLPSGEPITPLSLNEWLKNQSDGYIGEGLINWLALTRLTAQISLHTNQPKLEYQRINSQDLNTYVEIIKQNLPIILNIPGHFLVANGYISEPVDLIVLDPYFQYRHFTQHQQTLLSGRLFTPSHTDLSYILITSTSPLSVEAIDENHLHFQFDSYYEEIVDPISLQKTKIYLSQLAKPPISLKELKVSNQSTNQVDYQVYLYDQLGKTSQNQDSIKSRMTTSWKLHMTKDFSQTTPTIEIIESKQIDTWNELLAAIINWQQDGSHKRWHYLHYLSQLITSAKNAPVEIQKRYQILIARKINTLSFPLDVREHLSSIVKSINLDI